VVCVRREACAKHWRAQDKVSSFCLGGRGKRLTKDAEELTWKNIKRQQKLSNISSYLILATILKRLPRWLGGKERACQCRRYRFDP